MPPDALVPTTPKPEPSRRISKKLREAIRLLSDGSVRTQKAAAERVGLSETHVSRQMQLPHVRALFTDLASRTIATAAPRAAAKMLEIMDGESAHAAFNASEFLLKANGLGPSAETNVNVNVGVALAGYVLDLREPGEESSKAIDLIPQQEQHHDAS